MPLNIKFFISEILGLKIRQRMAAFARLSMSLPKAPLLLSFLGLFNIGGVHPDELHVLRVITYGCGFPLNKPLLRSLLRHSPTRVKFSGTEFIVSNLWDYFHASLCGERETLNFVLNHFRRGGVFIDVGANIGGYTVRLGKLGYVYAYEPHPTNFRKLVRNVKINNISDNVVLEQKAVADFNGSTELFIFNHSGKHSIIRRSTKSIKVMAVKLDDALAELNSIDMVKIDVEGAEPMVLRGLAQSLHKINIIIVETSIPSVKQFVFDYLTTKGFKNIGTFDECNSIFRNLSKNP